MNALLRITLAAAGVALGGHLAAQEPKVESKSPPPPAPAKPAANDYQVVPLRQGPAAEMAAVLQGVFGSGRAGATARIVADGASNSLLIAAPADEIAKIKDMIAKLDVPRPAPPRDEQMLLKVYHLQFVPADKVVQDALRLAIPGGQFLVDSRRNLVMVHADGATHRTVEDVLVRIDQPARTPPSADVLVRVVWLVSGTTDAAPPEDIKEILPTLAKLGIDKPRLAAQTLVNVRPNAEFNASGVAKLDGPCQFAVTGRYDQAKDATMLQITIRATRVGGPVAATGIPGGGRPGPSPEEIGHVQTTISAPPGHLVVLGVTPTDAMTSVFVVQVLRNEAKPTK